MIQINRNPTRRDLLVFGGLLGLFTLLAGLAAHLVWGVPGVARWIWAGGSGLTLLHFAVPPLRRFIYLAWMAAAFPIGWTLSHLLMVVVYFGVVTPTGVLLRMLGYDPMNRGAAAGTRASFWESYDTPKDRNRYFRQF